MLSLKLEFVWTSNLNLFFVAICGMINNLVSVIRYFSNIEFSGGSALDRTNNQILEESIASFRFGYKKPGRKITLSREEILNTFSSGFGYIQ